LGIIGAVDTLGWVLGHLYGGILVHHFSQNREAYAALFQQLGLAWAAPDWRALFWINVPITLVALVLTWWVLRGVRQERSTGRFDLVGTLLLVGSLIALVVGLGANIEVAASTTDFADLGGLPPYAGPLLLLSLLLFVAFIVVERRVRDPLFDLSIFRQRALSAGLLTNLFVGFVLMIGLVSVPILVNVRLPDSSQLAEAALRVGILLSALTVPMALAAIPGGWLSERVGYRVVALSGLLLALAGFVLMGATWNYEVSEAAVALHMALIGVGLGLTFSPISASVINSAPANRLGVASALVIILRLVGMTISVSVLTTVASERLAYLASTQIGGSLADAANALDTYSRLTVQVLAEIGWLGAGVVALALIPALFLRGRADRSRPPVMTSDRATQPAPPRR
jgi:MFS family permease